MQLRGSMQLMSMQPRGSMLIKMLLCKVIRNKMSLLHWFLLSIWNTKCLFLVFAQSGPTISEYLLSVLDARLLDHLLYLSDELIDLNPRRSYLYILSLDRIDEYYVFAVLMHKYSFGHFGFVYIMTKGEFVEK